MTDTLNRRFILEHPATRNLVKAAHEIHQAKDVKDVPEAARQMIENAGALVRSSLEVLMERDPMVEELGLIALLLRRSTNRSMQKITGELKLVYSITDDYLFACSADMAHGFETKFRWDGT